MDLTRVRRAFDAQAFRRQAHALVDTVADYLAGATAGDPTLAVLPWHPPAEELAAWPAHFPRPGASLAALLGDALARSIHLHHPGYVGHQVTSPLPEAALCDLVSSLLNNGAAVYEMGPVNVAAEKAVVRCFAAALGFPADADGVLTSGGSAGNLTALLAARQAKAGFDAWGGGASAGPPLTFLVATDTHYSVARAAKIMGLGERGAWPVPIDAAHRLRADALPEAFAAATSAGRRVIGVVASAGSTATGAIDPLAAVADFCATHDLWFHIDGAHGAAAVLSAAQRGRLAGIERADSVVWDAHKMMLMPALVTAVLFRDGRRGYQAFAQEASYLFSAVPPWEQWENLASRTLECTKEMMGLKVYVALALHGPEFFAAYIDGMFALARRFAAAIRAAADFELAVEPDCNIVCFRYRGAGAGAGAPKDQALDALQARIRQRVLERGAFYLVQATLPAGVFLRVTLINPFTDDGHLVRLLDAVRAAAAEG